MNRMLFLALVLTLIGGGLTNAVFAQLRVDNPSEEKYYQASDSVLL